MHWQEEAMVTAISMVNAFNQRFSMLFSLLFCQFPAKDRSHRH